MCISHTQIFTYRYLVSKLTIKLLNLFAELTSQFIKRVKNITQATCKRFVIVICVCCVCVCITFTK